MDFTIEEAKKYMRTEWVQPGKLTYLVYTYRDSETLCSYLIVFSVVVCCSWTIMQLYSVNCISDFVSVFRVNLCSCQIHCYIFLVTTLKNVGNLSFVSNYLLTNLGLGYWLLAIFPTYKFTICLENLTLYTILAIFVINSFTWRQVYRWGSPSYVGRGSLWLTYTQPNQDIRPFPDIFIVTLNMYLVNLMRFEHWTFCEMVKYLI